MAKGFVGSRLFGMIQITGMWSARADDTEMFSSELFISLHNPPGPQGDPFARLAPLLDVDPHLPVQAVFQLPTTLSVLFAQDEPDRGHSLMPPTPQCSPARRSSNSAENRI